MWWLEVKWNGTNTFHYQLCMAGFNQMLQVTSDIRVEAMSNQPSIVSDLGYIKVVEWNIFYTFHYEVGKLGYCHDKLVKILSLNYCCCKKCECSRRDQGESQCMVVEWNVTITFIINGHGDLKRLQVWNDIEVEPIVE